MPVLQEVSNCAGLYLVECPGCKIAHQIHTQNNDGLNWSFDGNMDSPTFAPSLNVEYTWGEKHVKNICHSYIRNGHWEFLGDCTHELAGQTVPMIDVD